MSAKTKTQGGSSPAPYKQKLLDARALRRKTGGILFDRMRLLCEVFEDRDFRADAGNVDDVRAAEVLDVEVDDTGFDFLQLREILQANPAWEAWEAARLSDLYEAVLEARRKTHTTQPAIRRRHVVRREEFDQLQTELTTAREKLQHVEVEAEVMKRRLSEVDKLRSELAEAHRTIERLERENGRLRRQLARREESHTPAGVNG